MAKLDLLINEPQKDTETQFKQIFLCLQNLFSWSNAILTQLALDSKEQLNAGDVSATSITYVALPPNYLNTISVKNPLSLISLNLQLQGSGYIGVFINGLLNSEIPFSNLSYSPVIHSYYYNLKVGSNTIEIKWRANSGTITKANSITNSGFNSLQVISFNS